MVSKMCIPWTFTLKMAWEEQRRAILRQQLLPRLDEDVQEI